MLTNIVCSASVHSEVGFLSNLFLINLFITCMRIVLLTTGELQGYAAEYQHHCLVLSRWYMSLLLLFCG